MAYLCNTNKREHKIYFKVTQTINKQCFMKKFTSLLATLLIATTSMAQGFTHNLTITDVGWATLMLGFNSIIPEGVTCYIVTELGTNSAKLTEVTNILPNNTAVIVKAEQGEYQFEYTAEGADQITNNKLEGSLFNREIIPDETTTYYVLSFVDDRVGLYPDELTDNIFLCNANKAYLPVTGATMAAGYSFVYDWSGTTGIDSAVAEEANDGKIYDITGRLVKSTTTRGIYIINGQKVIK